MRKEEDQGYRKELRRAQRRGKKINNKKKNPKERRAYESEKKMKRKELGRGK